MPEDAARVETPHFKYPRFLFTPRCYRFEEYNPGVGPYVVARVVPVNDAATLSPRSVAQPALMELLHLDTVYLHFVTSVDKLSKLVILQFDRPPS